jgi:hypothetical protein
MFIVYILMEDINEKRSINEKISETMPFDTIDPDKVSKIKKLLLAFKRNGR